MGRSLSYTLGFFLRLPILVMVAALYTLAMLLQIPIRGVMLILSSGVLIISYIPYLLVLFVVALFKNHPRDFADHFRSPFKLLIQFSRELFGSFGADIRHTYGAILLFCLFGVPRRVS